ncbi:MAG: AI-2E family transporter [Anaerolineales bacterium]
MKRLVWFTVVVLSTLMVVFLLWQFRGAVALFLLSLAVAAAVRPLVDYWVGRGMLRSVALLLVYLVGVGALGLLLYGISGPLLHELEQGGNNFVLAYDTLWATWPEGSPFQQTIVKWLPPPAELYQAIAGEQANALLQGLLGVTLSVFDILSQFVVVLMLSLYWSVDRVRFERLWLSVLPADQRARARDLWRAIETGVGAYIRSELVQSLLAGLLLGLGYWMIGLPYPTLLAIGSALAWMIPWLGAALASIPVLLVGLAGLNPGLAALAVVYTLTVFFVLEVVIEPKLFNQRQFSSLLVVLVVIALADVYGLLGVVIAPPLAAAIQIFFTHMLQQPAPAAAPDQMARQIADLDKRLVRVREMMNNLEAPASPQTVSMLERLNGLIERANAALLDSTLASADAPTNGSADRAHAPNPVR